MKHQYEDYKSFLDSEILMCDYNIDVSPITGNSVEIITRYRASLLANKATLERHKPIQILSDSKHDGGITHRCGGECRGRLGSHKVAPCPSLLDVTNQLDEVMG